MLIFDSLTAVTFGTSRKVKTLPYPIRDYYITYLRYQARSFFLKWEQD